MIGAKTTRLATLLCTSPSVRATGWQHSNKHFESTSNLQAYVECIREMPPKRNAVASSSRTRKKIKLQDEDDAVDISDAEFEPANKDEDSDASTYSQSHTKVSKGGKKFSGNSKGKGRRTRRPKDEANATAIARRRNQRGVLKLLLNVPVEIVLEVLRQLSPLDLLHLSRTSKAFRAILMRRSSNEIWAAAWKTDEDIPPCPNEMAAPAFADLMYGSWCHTPQKCLEYKQSSHHQYGWDDIEFGFRPEQYPLVFLIPGLQGDGYGSYEYNRVRNYAETYVSARLEDIVEFVNAWKAVPTEGREQFLQQRYQKSKERQEHARLCHQWEFRMRQKEIAQLEAAKLTRHNEIVKRLGAQGWAEVLEHLTEEQQREFKALPDVKLKKPLTDRTFQNMLPRLIPVMEKYQKEQETTRRVAAIEERIDILYDALRPIPDDHDLRPSLRDIVLSMPQAREAIDIPFRETMILDPILGALPTFTDEWRRKEYDGLATVVRRGAEAAKIPLDTDADLLTLALAGLFLCGICRKHVSLADALNHYCDYYARGGTISPSRLISPGVYTKVADEYLRAVPCALLRNYVGVVQTLHPIIATCGYNAATATIEDMDTTDIRLICTRCSDDHHKVILTWRAAVQHCGVGWPHSGKVDTLEKASQADATAAKLIEEEKLEAYTRTRMIRCAHCSASTAWRGYKGYSQERWNAHLASCHNIDEPKAADGFYTTTLPRVWEEAVCISQQHDAH
ncbi:hypothetical protein NM688_g4932 [Phlebia brevispora]|uniref:Uncharacterized protein n=1 Tax=Phlebia brevispora TaxID=194682 RepID=A0ACC1T1I4_9APHY|nr:hypothetical protein NM688_g4932 [Phlebia brevispora]